MAKRDIVIVGSGGLAREVRWLIEECNKQKDCWNTIGWISNETPGTVVMNLPVLGSDEWLLDRTEPIDVAIGIGSGLIRKRIIEKLKQNELLSFPCIISPSAEMSDSVKLGEGCIITAKSVLTVDIAIGNFFYCNLACTVGHDCHFGDYVTLNPGVCVSGNVVLEEGVTVGTGATIIQGLTVGNYSIIGAGAAVVRDVESGCTVVGVPARILKRGEGRE